MERRCLLLGPLTLLLASTCPAADSRDLLAQIKAVGREGQGNAAAAKAWKELVALGPDVMTDVLAAMDDASPRAANWLRPAFEAIADRALASGKLSAATLEAFVRDTRHTGPPRRLAYEWLMKVDPKAAQGLLPGMIHDPGQELRREAVAVLLKEAAGYFDANDPAAAKAMYRKILESARDRDQVKIAAERLGKLGESVDLTAHFGFLTQWSVAGPFDNSKGKGFYTVFPPEKGVDLRAEYTGKNEQRVRWQSIKSNEPLGKIDLNKVYKDPKGDDGERMLEAVVFAYTTVQSKQERPVEIRAGSNNAIRIWLNGNEIFFRDEYHHGQEMDQHVGKGTLKAGRNEILVKVCQNHQTDSWARQWSFQLRICDALGAAVPVTVLSE